VQQATQRLAEDASQEVFPGQGVPEQAELGRPAQVGASQEAQQQVSEQPVPAHEQQAAFLQSALYGLHEVLQQVLEQRGPEAAEQQAQADALQAAERPEVLAASQQAAGNDTPQGAYTAFLQAL